MSILIVNKRKRTSDVWNHFTIVKSGSATCNVCNKTLNFHASSTSNLSRHYRTRHQKHEGYENGKTNMSGEFIEVGEEYEVETGFENNGQQKTSPGMRKVNKKYGSSFKPAVQNNTAKSNTESSNMIQEAIAILSNLAQKSTPDNDADEYSQFGNYVSHQLRELPVLNALQLQEKIYCLITRERIAVMTNPNESKRSALKSFIEKHHTTEDQEEYVEECNDQEWLMSQSEETVQLEDNTECQPNTD